MGSKLFVGGLAWGTDDDRLREAFEEFGVIKEAKVINDRETGRSKGFGFVTFDTEAEATAAMSGMDGSNLDGRNIRVNEAEDKRGGGGGGRGPRPSPREPQVERRGGGKGDGNSNSAGGDRPPRRGPPSGGRSGGWGDRD
jgi:RNA recognition motif-containing protein